MKRVLLCVVLGACSGPGGSMGGDDEPGVDAVTGDGPGSGGTDKRLYPLEVGRTWTYDVTSTYPSCPGGQREQRVVSKGTTDGRETYRVASFCGGTEVNVSAAGDRVDSYYDWGPKGWYRMLDEPVADGHVWTTTNGSATFTQTYDQLGDHGGRKNCWKVIQNVTYTSYWIYCEGVGLVFSEMIDLGGGTIRAELRSTSF